MLQQSKCVEVLDDFVQSSAFNKLTTDLFRLHHITRIA